MSCHVQEENHIVEYGIPYSILHIQHLLPTPGQDIQIGPVTLENGVQKGGCVLHPEMGKSEVSEIGYGCYVDLTSLTSATQSIINDPTAQQQGCLPAPLGAPRAICAR